jgi:uncharacterized small protein (DUF1192 family)
MDTDSAAGPPAPAAPAPARRNDTRQRVLALEERVSAQNEQASLVGHALSLSLACSTLHARSAARLPSQIALMQSHIARLEAKMDLLIASGA